MASWVFCNRCFQPPHRTSCFSLTNCGHVYCDVCLDKGRKGECLICKVPCRTLLLSEHVSSNMYYLNVDQCPPQPSLRPRARCRAEALRTWRSGPGVPWAAAGHEGHSTGSQEFRSSPVAARVHLLLLSTAGSVARRGPQPFGPTPSHRDLPQALRVPPLPVPGKGLSQAPAPQAPGRAGRGGSPSLGGSRAAAPRQPISISALLQRQHAGSAGLEGVPHGR
uniref:probable E3 SUMO-protein ligase RNF212 n=1 Tax=Panthera onca TaxID=9690 RepID=UPI0029558443|nr:probable E3 SUMO-protein ligase RNF212 [Panthera onca]